MEAPDGKQRVTDVADTEQLLRLIQSIPSPKEKISYFKSIGDREKKRKNDIYKAATETIQRHKNNS